MLSLVVGVQAKNRPRKYLHKYRKLISLFSICAGRLRLGTTTAFECEDIRIRVDVLEHLVPGTWGLREVKRSSDLKDHHLDDIALQTYVLRVAGVTISSIELLHVNTAYVRRPLVTHSGREHARSGVRHRIMKHWAMR